jgi:predicted DNA-binding mobile mystery protein A
MFDLKQTIQQQYQNKVNQVLELKKYSRPKEGWIRTLRKALGMSGPQLGHRIGIKRAQISQMERMEIEDRITVGQLRRVAEALDCDLVYALVPRQSIETMLEKRAITKATALVTKVDAQMTLEAQQLNKDALAKEIRRETKRLLETMPRDLWED